MRTPKFKVGDRVKVLRKATKNEHDLWGDSWIYEMGGDVGKVFTIDYVYRDGWQEGYEYCKYSMEESGYAYPEFVLQKEIVKGEQLLFDFMK